MSNDDGYYSQPQPIKFKVFQALGMVHYTFKIFIFLEYLTRSKDLFPILFFSFTALPSPPKKVRDYDFFCVFT